MKKFLSAVLSVVIIISICFCANAQGKYLYFESNGGSVGIGKLYYDDTQSIISGFPPAEKIGYSFEGWYEDESFTGNAVTFLTVNESTPTTLFAKWSPLSYNVKYNYGITALISEKVQNNNPDKIDYSQTVALANPVCDGYFFDGWFTDGSFSQRVTEIKGSVGKDITLYAKWKVQSFKINYNLVCDGVNIKENDIENSNPLTRNTNENVILIAPTLKIDGYTFAGWFTDSEYKNTITEIPSYSAKNYDLYALWTVNDYKIEYDYGVVDKSKYSVINDNPTSYTFGVGTEIKDIFSDNGAYSFEGWYTDKNLTKKISEISNDSHGDIKLYSKWSEKKFKVDYILTDPVIDIDVSLVENPNESERTSVKDIALQSLVFDRQLYSFKGWYLDKARTQKIDVIKAGTNKDLTLYALWGDAEYTVTYDYGIVDSSLAEIVNGNITSYKPDTHYIFSEPTVQGFLFNGWYSDKDCKIPMTEINGNMTGDLTVYASFTEKTYTLSYELTPEGTSIQDFEAYSNNPALRTVKESVALKEPTTFNVFYSFGGWFLDSEYNEPISEIKAYTVGNITIYAKWIKIISYVPVWGDATVSNGLNTADAKLILRYSARLEELSDTALLVSDINNDGKINTSDARTVLKLCAKLDSIETLVQKYSLKTITVSEGKIILV